MTPFLTYLFLFLLENSAERNSDDHFLELQVLLRLLKRKLPNPTLLRTRDVALGDTPSEKIEHDPASIPT